jgi:hypothetical protein
MTAISTSPKSQLASISSAIGGAEADLQRRADHFCRDPKGHVPEFEMVYHLRNAVARGNRFNITRKGRERLKAWPADNKE